MGFFQDLRRKIIWESSVHNPFVKKEGIDQLIEVSQVHFRKFVGIGQLISFKLEKREKENFTMSL